MFNVKPSFPFLLYTIFSIQSIKSLFLRLILVQFVNTSAKRLFFTINSFVQFLLYIFSQRSPNHILTVKLYFHRLVVIQIDHAHKGFHTFFCQPTDVRFLTGLLCQSANFFIQFIGTLLFFLFCPYAILQCSQLDRKSVV